MKGVHAHLREQHNEARRKRAYLTATRRQEVVA
jgi:hypothetical protein